MKDNPVRRHEDELPEELIDGKRVVMAPSSSNHARVCGNIASIFSNHLHGKKKCVSFGFGEKVVLTPTDHFVPDVMVVCDRSKIKPDAVYGAPDLVVEILSPRTVKNDRGRKMEVYGQCGVREYWIVSAGEQGVEVYRNEDGLLKLSLVAALCPDWMLERMNEREKSALITEFKCSLYDDLVIKVDDIFYDLF